MHYCWLKILNVVQVFSPAQAVTVCYCCYCCSVVSKQKMPKNPGKTRKYLGFSRYFRVLPALDAGDRRGSLPGLPYCCSAGLTLATVVGEPHCCSVVTVNTSNTVQLLTVDSSRPSRDRRALWGRARVSASLHVYRSRSNSRLPSLLGDYLAFRCGSRGGGGVARSARAFHRPCQRRAPRVLCGSTTASSAAPAGISSEFTAS